ncbi:hypothetical protein H5410_050636 [Solanum commersonii]|uniref:Uncharacterized protein n=1 Tax=Solanum commersonii TaxID=4109 RepID=A0A9J5WW04_SOLCO|nr:hypothetical protein H5410_050636 [Solanum commersonii]
MPLVELEEQPIIQGDDMFKNIIDNLIHCSTREAVLQVVCPSTGSKFDDKLSTLYFNIVDDHGEA